VNRLKRIAARLRAPLVSDILNRLARVEYHAINRRFYAVEQIAEYL